MKKAGREGKTAVIVVTVTYDQRVFEIPKKLTVSLVYLFQQNVNNSQVKSYLSRVPLSKIF